MRYIRNLALGGCLLALVVGIVFFRSKRKKPHGQTARILAEQAYREAKDKHDGLHQTSEIVLKDADLHLFGSDKLKACQVQAKESRVFPNNQITECVDIDCKLTTNDNQVAKLLAPKAIIDRNKKTILFPGTIIGTFTQWHLSKRDAFYDANKHEITAHNTTVTSTGGISSTCKTSIIDLKNEIIYLEGEVVSTFCAKK